jgi:hypothetical protein
VENEGKNHKPAPPKKLRPYPFDAMLDQVKPVEVLFVSHTGLIAKLGKIFVQVGEHHQIQFALPGSKHAVMTQVRVLKTYDKSTLGKGKDRVVERVAEFHFEKLSAEHKEYISGFMAAIGQHK